MQKKLEMAIRGAKSREAVFKAFNTFNGKLSDERCMKLMSEKTGMQDITIKSMLQGREYLKVQRAILKKNGISLPY